MTVLKSDTGLAVSLWLKPTSFSYNPNSDGESRPPTAVQESTCNIGQKICLICIPILYHSYKSRADLGTVMQKFRESKVYLMTSSCLPT